MPGLLLVLSLLPTLLCAPATTLTILQINFGNSDISLAPPHSMFGALAVEWASSATRRYGAGQEKTTGPGGRPHAGTAISPTMLCMWP